ncbi:hypothetical protein BDR22DRAFT_852564 [Usnea florida]
MYIIGNSETYKYNPMWSKVIRLLEDAGNTGTSLPLCCPQHPDVSIEVSTPNGFLHEAPEGGYALQCGVEFDRGHLCTYKCHSMARHQSDKCKVGYGADPDCGHHCHKPCNACRLKGLHRNENVVGELVANMVAFRVVKRLSESWIEWHDSF